MKTSKTHYYKFYISLLRDYYDKKLSLIDIQRMLGPDYNYWKSYYLDYEETINAYQKQLETALIQAQARLFEYNFRKNLLQIQIEGLKYAADQFERFQSNDMDAYEKLTFSLRLKKGNFKAQLSSYFKNQRELTELASNFKRDFGLLFRF